MRDKNTKMTTSRYRQARHVNLPRNCRKLKMNTYTHNCQKYNDEREDWKSFPNINGLQILCKNYFITTR